MLLGREHNLESRSKNREICIYGGGVLLKYP